MKIILPIAHVAAITNLMLEQGEDQVPALAIKIESTVSPDVLEELRPGLRDIFFEPGKNKAPSIPRLQELEALSWKTEYQKGTLTLDLEDTDGLAFEDQEIVLAGVDVKAITFEPLATGMCNFKCNAVVRGDELTRGKITALLKHTVKASFSKLMQKPLLEPSKPQDDAAGQQGRLDAVH